MVFIQLVNKKITRNEKVNKHPTLFTLYDKRDRKMTSSLIIMICITKIIIPNK